MDELKYLNSIEKKALAELIDQLKKQFKHNIKKIKLFGSKIRGDFDKDS